jgi:hypothetical protein
MINDKLACKYRQTGRRSMSATPQLFRALMLASLGLSILAFIIDITVPSLVPEVVRFAEEQYWNGTSSVRRPLLFSKSGRA